MHLCIMQMVNPFEVQDMKKILIKAIPELILSLLDWAISDQGIEYKCLYVLVVLLKIMHCSHDKT
jgi:hypothetical protein